MLHNGSVETRSVEEQYRHLLAAREAPESVLLIEPSGMERRVSIDELSRRRSGEFWLNDRLYDEVMVVSLGAIETG